MEKKEYKYSEKREYILDALDNYLYNLKGMHDHYKELCDKREKEIDHLESKIHDLNDVIENLKERVEHLNNQLSAFITIDK
jgi:predicted  nucleic acid-binding Zn-ribbon protein